MGTKHQRALAYTQQTSGEAALRSETDRRLQSERVFGMASNMLGTDEQLAGYDTDPRMAEYSQRYSLDEEALRGYFNSSSRISRQRAGIRDDYGKAIGAANELLTQAEAAAKAGDWEQAQALRSQAESTFGGKFGAAFKLGGGSVEAQAKGILSGPQAQIVGQQVKRAREFGDWNSAGSTQWRQQMAEGAERSIAAEANSARRQARDLGLQAGSGRMAGTMAALQNEASRNAATQRAQVHTTVNQAFLQYRDAFQQNAVEFATNWLNEASGIRTGFNTAMQNMAGMVAEMYGQGAKLSAGFAQMANDEEARNALSRGSMYGQLATLAGGAVGALLGPAGAALGGKLAGAIVPGSQQPTQ